MKMARERRPEPKKNTEKKKGNTAGTLLDEKDEPLFERLRTLRMQIAREEKVPPYIVFSDRSLVHMCILKPKDKAEMLQVNGVGEHKYSKYGERFLEEINRAV